MYNVVKVYKYRVSRYLLNELDICFVSLFIYFVVSLQMQLAHFLLKEILEKLNSFRVWKNDIFAKCFIRFRYQWYSCNSGIAIFAKRVNKHFAYSLFNSFQLNQIKSNHKGRGWQWAPVVDWSFKSFPCPGAPIIKTEK